MTAQQMSARFAAYVWYLHQPNNVECPQMEAHDYAKHNWQQFLPIAPTGFGRLLLKLAKAKQRASVTPTVVIAQ